nr:MAG TPA: Minor capsid protein [Caudoviricetes sp.]
MKINYNTKNINMINNIAKDVLLDTAEAIKTDLIQSKTMPFDTGTMQNDSTFVDDKRLIKGVAKLVTDTPYARKVYFDPEITIHQDKNPNAKQHWFDDYISGGKKNLPIKYFQQMLRRKMK